MCSDVLKMCFISENAKEQKNSEIENGRRNLGEKISLYVKKTLKKPSREHQRSVKSKKNASIETTEALGFPELDLDECELEDDNCWD